MSQGHKVQKGDRVAGMSYGMQCLQPVILDIFLTLIPLSLSARGLLMGDSLAAAAVTQ